MNCKKCGEDITFYVFGMPDDICYGCLTSKEKSEVVGINVGITRERIQEDELEGGELKC